MESVSFLSPTASACAPTPSTSGSATSAPPTASGRCFDARSRWNQFPSSLQPQAPARPRLLRAARLRAHLLPLREGALTHVPDGISFLPLFLRVLCVSARTPIFFLLRAETQRSQRRKVRFQLSLE